MSPLFRAPRRRRLAAAAALLATSLGALASSHREAPSITAQPKVDATDFYMFRSYESGRGAFVTLIADYLPLQDGYGGPNYFKLDPDALYEIHVDNDGDANENLTFQFRFSYRLANENRGIKLNIVTVGRAARNPKEFSDLGGAAFMSSAADAVYAPDREPATAPRASARLVVLLGIALAALLAVAELLLPLRWRNRADVER